MRIRVHYFAIVDDVSTHDVVHNEGEPFIANPSVVHTTFTTLEEHVESYNKFNKLWRIDLELSRVSTMEELLCNDTS